jgi:hypothetical protein
VPGCIVQLRSHNLHQPRPLTPPFPVTLQALSQPLDGNQTGAGKPYFTFGSQPAASGASGSFIGIMALVATAGAMLLLYLILCIYDRPRAMCAGRGKKAGAVHDAEDGTAPAGGGAGEDLPKAEPVGKGARCCSCFGSRCQAGGCSGCAK